MFLTDTTTSLSITDENCICLAARYRSPWINKMILTKGDLGERLTSNPLVPRNETPSKFRCSSCLEDPPANFFPHLARMAALSCQLKSTIKLRGDIGWSLGAKAVQPSFFSMFKRGFADQEKKLRRTRQCWALLRCPHHSCWTKPEKPEAHPSIHHFVLKVLGTRGL